MCLIQSFFGLKFEMIFVLLTKMFELCRFYFDFSMTYVGAGMICSHLVNLSLLLGAVLSYGIMWPLIRGLKGDWYSGSLSESSMKSLNGYKVLNWLLPHPYIINQFQDFFLIISILIFSLIFLPQVFISISLILGDGLYNFVKILCFTAINIHAKMKRRNLQTCK